MTLADHDKLVGRLDIDSHVLRQLGDQLITDQEQALLELVKNSFDADAEWSRVKIDTQANVRGQAPGTITVEDNGDGMSLEAIRAGWLLISLSPKREMKAKGIVTKKFRRTPLGDKGLGRLGTMRLGDRVQLVTHTATNAPGHRLVLDWSQYTSGTPLGSIVIPIEQIPASGRKGTTVTITGLRDVPYWRGARRAESLTKKMTGLVSPFEEFASFEVSLDLDGHSVELNALDEKTRQTATVLVDFAWDGTTLSATLKAKLRILHAPEKEEQYKKLILKDSGKRFLAFLSRQKGAANHGIKGDPAKGWFVEFGADWAATEVLQDVGSTVAEDPGPLRGEILSVEMDDVVGGNPAVVSLFAELRAFVRASPGIGVFRDGFGVRMPEDWLGLGRGWTNASNYYGLKPANTAGFVALSAGENSKLVEKSDREGFIETPAYSGLQGLLKVVLKFSNDSLGYLRRKYVEYADGELATATALPSKWEPIHAIETLKQVASNAKRRKGAAQAFAETRKTQAQAARKLTEALRADDLPKGTQAKVTALVDEFERVTLQWTKKLEELTETAADLGDEEQLAEAILERFEQMEHQIAEVYDMVGIGLTAQALAHDVYSILDDLFQRSQRIGKTLKATDSPHIAGFVEAVKASVNSLRRQVSILDSVSRGARETRQKIRMADFVSEFFEMRQEALKSDGIEFVPEVTRDFAVNFNRGRLLQVLDNLVRNSQYWLSNAKARSKKIHIQISDPYLTVWDSGPGVKPAVEQDLFQLFVSGKPKDEGSGLGLFIVSQLLENEDCSVLLEDERNEGGRRYRFQIDLSGAKIG